MTTKLHAGMTDRSKQIEAQYHLEMCFEPNEKGQQKKFEEVADHIWAAHYLVQSMDGGHIPKNYDEVMLAAMKHTTRYAAAEAIHFAKNGNLDLNNPKEL